MAKKPQRQWVYSPSKAAIPPLPEALKAEVEAKAQQIVDAFKTTHIQPPPAEPRFNYLIDIWTKWRGRYFYFCETYASPFPNALSPTFEARFARMEYRGARRFSLAYMRHTEQWQEVFTDLPLEEALEAIRTQPYFFPG